MIIEHDQSLMSMRIAQLAQLAQLAHALFFGIYVL
jgi:hypothetical protein